MFRSRSKKACVAAVSSLFLLAGTLLIFISLSLIQINEPYNNEQYADNSDSQLCSCGQRESSSIPNSNGIISHCSKEATEYGPGQKVISFSMYVTAESDIVRYSSGLEPNLQAISKIYPSWLLRVYTNISRNHENSCRLRCTYKHLFWCDIQDIPGHGDLSTMNPRAWRFLALGDPTVDIFISRDLDSVVSERERIAVRQWEESNYTIHSMRDHPEHSVELLGGMWGVKNAEIGQNVTRRMQQLIILDAQVSHSRGWDEEIIARHVYRPHHSSVLAHDSYHCEKHADGLTMPFVTRRQDNSFVGQVIVRTNYTAEPCPVKCRPAYGKHWGTC